jgi:cytochrome P450
MHIKHPLNLMSAQFGANDLAYYAWLRNEAPVYKGKYAFMTAYFISRYDDVTALLKDPRLVRNRSRVKGGSKLPFPAPKMIQLLANNMLLEDEPEHRRLRNLVHKAFTPRTVAQMSARMEHLTHELLDKAAKKGEVDLMDDYALPIPATIIAEMVGVPKEDERVFLEFSHALANPVSVKTIASWYFGIRGLMKYSRTLIAKRRANPQDDLLSGLILAEDEGQKLTEDELISMVLLLVLAGYETTVNLISNATKALLEHPEQLSLLRAQPALMDSMIEEVIRYDGPVQSTKPMYNTESITLHGVTIPRGATVFPLLGSANRDETVFERANQFDITRSPNKHVGFGQGIHYCLGAPLARLESKVALTNLLERFPDLRLAVAPEQIRYLPRPMMHRLERLPVALT